MEAGFDGVGALRRLQYGPLGLRQVFFCLREPIQTWNQTLEITFIFNFLIILIYSRNSSCFFLQKVRIKPDLSEGQNQTRSFRKSCLLTDAGFPENEVRRYELNAGQAVHVDGEFEGLEGRRHRRFMLAFKEEFLTSLQRQVNHFTLEEGRGMVHMCAFFA